METKKQMKYFAIFDYEKEQDYLRQMHQSGWRFVKVTGLGMYHFERCQPQDVVYQLDYNQEGLANKEEYHFICTKEMVDTIAEPLSTSLIRRYHHCLTYGTYSDKKHKIGVGEYRKGVDKLGVSARQIQNKLDELIKSYEEECVDFNVILAFHVGFEKIHPFDDYNGRVGRLIINEGISGYLNIINKEKSAVRATGVAPKQTWTYMLCGVTDITIEDDDEYFDKEDDNE